MYRYINLWTRILFIKKKNTRTHPVESPRFFSKHFYVINAAQGSNPPKLIFIALVSEQRQRGRRKEACRKKGKLSTKNVEKC